MMFCKTFLVCFVLCGVALGSPHITISPYRRDAQVAYKAAAYYHRLKFLTPVFAQADYYDNNVQRYTYFYLTFKADLRIFPTTVKTCYVEVSWLRNRHMSFGPKQCY